MKKKIAVGFAVVSLNIVFGAGNILADNAVNHEVRKRDTLWGISGDYLTEPRLWPKVWKFNPRIANPHLIYPGQVVRVPGVEITHVYATPVNTEAVMAASDDSPLARAGRSSTSGPLPVFRPTVAQLPAADQAQDGQSVMPAKHYDLGVGMLTSVIPGEGRVLQTRQGWHSAGLGEAILISAPGAVVGRQFGVYRDLGEVKPLAYFGESPGHLLAEVAVVEIVASSDGKPEAVVRRASGELRDGDVLGPVPERIAVAPRIEQTGAKARGEVVAVHSMRGLAGPDDIVYLNIGARHGLAPGDILPVAGIEQDGTRPAGEIMVLKVAADTAAAVVTGRSSHDVRRGDMVGAIL